MKTLVAYRSTYGYTKQYAEWIAESLGADLADVSKGGLPASGFDRLIYGGSLYAGKISGIEQITKNPSLMEGGSLFIFVVGMEPYNTKNFQKTLASNGIPEKLFPRCFHFRGGMDASRFNFSHRLMMYILRLISPFIPEKDLARYFLQNCAKPVSYVSKESIDSLIKAAQ